MWAGECCVVFKWESWRWVRQGFFTSKRAKLIGQATAQICYSVCKSVWPGFEKQTNMFVFGINLCSKVLLVDNSIIWYIILGAKQPRWRQELFCLLCTCILCLCISKLFLSDTLREKWMICFFSLVDVVST